MMRRKGTEANPAISPEIAQLLSETPPTDEVVQDLEAAAVDLDLNPAFVADFLKAQFVEDILRTMEASGLNKNALAEKLGKSRQYVGRILNETGNFTIETMAEIGCALGAQVAIRLCDRGEHMAIHAAPTAARRTLWFESPPRSDVNKAHEILRELRPEAGAINLVKVKNVQGFAA